MVGHKTKERPTGPHRTGPQPIIAIASPVGVAACRKRSGALEICLCATGELRQIAVVQKGVGRIGREVFPQEKERDGLASGRTVRAPNGLRLSCS